jgi:hypothetical protein
MGIMASRAKSTAVIAVELKAAVDDWNKKERRFAAVTKSEGEHLESVIDLAARASEDASKAVYKLLRRATGARVDQTCVAVFPNGSCLIAVREAGDRLADEPVTLLLVPASRVRRLS